MPPFDKTGRNTASAKVQRYSEGLLLVDGGRIEVEGLKFFDDFFQQAIDTTNLYDVGVEGDANAVEILEGLNGLLQITTGTTADKRNCIATKLIFAAARGVIVEARIKTLTSQAGLLFFFGLTDNADEGAGLIPVADTALAAATITANADDFVGFAARVESNVNLYCVSGKATDLQSADSGVDLTLGTYMILRIELDTSGNAKFYINGTYVGALANAITAADPLCLYLGGLITTGTTAALLNMDYWVAYQARVA